MLWFLRLISYWNRSQGHWWRRICSRTLCSCNLRSDVSSSLIILSLNIIFTKCCCWFQQNCSYQKFQNCFYHFLFQSKISFKVIHHQFVKHMQSFSLMKLLQINYYSYRHHSRSLESRLFDHKILFFDGTTLSFWNSSRFKHWEVSNTRPTFSRKSQDRLQSIRGRGQNVVNQYINVIWTSVSW